MTKTETHAGNLKLIGSWLCLDFVNTVDCRNSDRSHEWLTKYSDLVSWSQHTGILTDSEARELLQKAELYPTDAKEILDRAIVLREALYRIFSTIYRPSSSDVIILNAELSKARAWLQLVPTTDKNRWGYARKCYNALDRMLRSIALSAEDLLTSDKLDRVNICAAKDCGWLFLDTSRNRSRKWCAMKDCGNRAKAQRHYQRQCSLQKKATDTPRA